jgi:hypothetical protein
MIIHQATLMGRLHTERKMTPWSLSIIDKDGLLYVAISNNKKYLYSTFNNEKEMAVAIGKLLHTRPPFILHHIDFSEPGNVYHFPKRKKVRSKNDK